MQNSTLLIDQKYAPLISGRVRNFKAKGGNIYNCSCPICGDSGKKTSKARFYVFPSLKGGCLAVSCHNCGYSSRLGKFFKEHMPDIYQQYCFDLIADKNEVRAASPEVKLVKRRQIEGGVLKGLRRISQLPFDHYAKKYVVDRMLPTWSHASLYFTPNFAKWLNGLDPDNPRFQPASDPRLVIPLIDKHGEVFAVQGRALSDQRDRYLTHKFNPDHPKVFGLDRVDPNRQIKILEGPLDSFFPTNALAMAGADVSIASLIDLVHTTREHITYVFDNEPRNIHIIKRIKKCIDQGVKVVIWPDSIKSKDLNAAVMQNEIPATEMDLFIERNTYSGMDADLHLVRWSRIN